MSVGNTVKIDSAPYYTVQENKRPTVSSCKAGTMNVALD
jgi:hypothetical protein